ncbi:MAG: glycosyltransferase family 2 protein, partial [Anaerolineales bacterium]
MQASVVIPTFNRGDSLLRTLESLENQPRLAGEFEVTVVDDGSDTVIDSIPSTNFGYPIRCVKGPHRGATYARNRGARMGNGEVLVFIDDDVTLSNTALKKLIESCMAAPNRVAIGNLQDRCPEPDSVFANVVLNQSVEVEHLQRDEQIPFVECNTQLLAVGKSEFFDLGMLKDPTGGWPNWDDVDFGYRARRSGFQIVRSMRATGVHWDYSLSDLRTACDRWYRAAYSAASLFRVHPDLFQHIEMFHDKVPKNWRGDPMPL